MKKDPIDHVPIEEVRARLRQMSRAEVNAASAFARARAAQTGMSVDDVLQEAAYKAYSGERNWSRALEFMKFFYGAIRGISSDDLKKRRKEQGLLARWGYLYELEASQPEDLFDKKGAVALLLPNDEIAQNILMDVMDGMEPQAIRRKYKLSDTEYDSKRKKIRRAFEKYQASQLSQRKDKKP